MPVMTKMRDSMPVVFAALAVIFLLMIIFEWGGQGSIFNRNTDQETLGLVNGHKITRKQYDRIFQAVVDKMKSENKRGVLSEVEEDQAGDQAWDEAVSESIIDQAVDRMGITVTDQDVRDAIFENPPAQVKKDFTDSMGVFHQDWYVKALRDPRNDTIVRTMEASVRDQLRRVKWQAAVISTIRVTDSEAYQRYINDSAKAAVQIVRLIAPQPTPEQLAKIPQKELEDYYTKHSYQYKQPERRKFKFVAFQQTPNARDTAQAKEAAASIAGRLKEASPAELDTVARELALDYSDKPYGPAHPISMADLVDDTTLMSAKAGDVAVVRIKGQFNVVRVLETSDSGHELFHLRQIMINFNPADPHAKDSARAVAEQVMAQLRAGGDFSALARAHSSDPRTALKGGDLGWTDTMMVPPSARKEVAHGSIGSIEGPFEAGSTFAIEDILGRSRRMWIIISVPFDIKPSHQTLLLHQQMANVFREQALKQGFDEAAKAAGYKVYTDAPPAQKKGTPIFSSHAFVDWIFDASKGDICQPMKMAAQHMILVAQLTDIIPEGPAPLEEVKSRVAPEVAKREAVAALATRAQQVRAALGTGADMNAAARALGDSSLVPISTLMGPAESVNGLPSAEYVINNWAYSAQPGAVSPPLKGENGYYIAKLNSNHIPTQKDFEAVRPLMQREIFQEREQRFLMDWVQNQKDAATIVDNRVKR
ncbi:MAG: SurA N-terminal domain-containing protein [Bacteroidota bacterium]|nr:SurA N-terminal domain-containing protein [Bacteroidota bacterium]MDP4232838.1 SurA N-terminal domain-containing protein [Bacteroidota bacterium]MDP4241882.1 SurA N-terminal domain-containing protein [Bacteroidota bacterium]MDP4288207.1 SurA N-terminal domain-containing protein [Bacteroidota bacterium]